MQKRSNSRNQNQDDISPQHKKSSKPRFNQTSETQGLSRQQVDLFKSSTQQRNEIEQLMGNIELPDDSSLTISSMSQSPWNGGKSQQSRTQQFRQSHFGGTRQNFSNTNGTQETSHDNDGTLGRSEFEESKSLIYTREEHKLSNYVDESDQHQSSSQMDMTPVHQRRGRSKHEHTDQTSHLDVSDDNDGRDSPDFNRDNRMPYNPHQDCDDLAISAMGLSQNNMTNRSTNLLDLQHQLQKRGQGPSGQNRTFADSVINHHNQQYSSSTSNTHREPGSVKGSQRGPSDSQPQISRRQIFNPLGGSPGLGSGEKEEIEERSDDDDDYGEEDQTHINRRQQDFNNLDSSDLSCVESFTQTQYSKLSKIGGYKSKIFPKISANSLEDGQSPYTTNPRDYQGDESLSMTPSSNDKYMLSNQNYSKLPSNRTVQEQTGNTMYLRQKLQLPDGKSSIGTNNSNQTDSKNQYNNTQLFGNRTHNRSRDPELEQALEEESQNQTIEKSTISETGREFNTTLDQPIGNSQEYQKLKFDNSHLNIQLQKLKFQLQQNDERLQETMSQLEQAESSVNNMNEALADKDQYIDLLKEKVKGANKLEDLRGKLLDNTKRQLKNLNRVILDKDKRIQMLENKIIQQEKEDQADLEIFESEIKKLTSELSKEKIKYSALIKQNTGQEQDQIRLKENYENLIQRMKNDHKIVINDLQNKLQSQVEQIEKLNRKIKTFDNTKQDLNAQIENLYSVIQKKDQHISKVEKDCNKAQTEMRSFQERCKEVENELEMLRHGTENNSIFANNTTMNNKSMLKTGGEQSYEIKQVKDMYQTKLNKAQQDATKYTQLYKEMETKYKHLEIETKRRLQESTSQINEKLDRDQEIINELSRAKNQVKHYLQQEEEIRYCFNIGENEDLTTRLVDIQSELQDIPLLKQEVNRLQIQLSEAQARELKMIEQSTGKDKEQPVSQYALKQLMGKDKEISNLRQEKDKEREDRIKVEHQKFSLESNLRMKENEIKELEAQIDLLTRELDKVKEGKDKAERNVDDLKDRLRTVMREHQESLAQKSVVVRDKYCDEVERKKYDGLIQAVLDLNLVQDPLNMCLQESYVDEYEQALKHITEQTNLVSDTISQLTKEKSQVEMKLAAFEQETTVKQSQWSSLMEQTKREISQWKNLNEQKERQLESLGAEHEEMRNCLERQTQELRNLEQRYSTLKIQNDEVSQNFRKVMRAQDHLHKGDQSLLKSKQSKVNMSMLKDNNDEVNRVMMEYEDQLSKIERGYVKDILKARDIAKMEMMETFDALINSQAKLPNENEITRQLIQRIEKIRHQEKLKLQELQPQVQTYQGLFQTQFALQQQKSITLTVEQVNELMIIKEKTKPLETINNEDMLQSISKYLRLSKSQYRPEQQTAQFKNFWKEDDGNSLMLSELMGPKQTTPFDQEMVKKDEIIEELKRQLEDQGSNRTFVEANQVLLHEIKDKTKQIQTLELQLTEKDLEIESIRVQMNSNESQQQFKQQQVWKEVESLKESIKQQLLQKSQELEEQYEELEQQKSKQKDLLTKHKQELDQAFAQKVQQQEADFRSRMQKMESEIKSGCEKSKEEQISDLMKTLEDNYQSRMKQQQDDFTSQLRDLKQEHIQKIEEIKKQKDRDSKKLKDELEKQKKQSDDQAKKTDQERDLEKEAIEREWKEKLESLTQKAKKDLKAAQDKVRAEMRNQIDSVKNDLAKCKAEFEREKKKLLADQTSELDQAKRSYEELLQVELKNQKDKLDKIHKKKLEEKDKEGQVKIDEIEREIIKIREAHKEELKKEKDRLEVRLKEQVRSEVRVEVHEEFEGEVRDQIERLKSQHQLELDKIRSKFEVQLKEERASQIPMKSQEFKPKQPTRDAETQCGFGDQSYYETEEDEDGVVLHNKNQSHQSSIRQSREQSSYMSQLQMSRQVEQMKQSFEEELERQQQVFEVQLIARQQTSVRIFQELLTLEFDKILQSIYHKSVNVVPMSQQELEMKRNQINKVIADILMRNDDKKEQQMKQSMEAVKKKISEVLRVFKQELEAKLNKKQDQVVKEKVEQQLRSHNISDIMSVQNNQQYPQDQESFRHRRRETYTDYSSDQDESAQTPQGTQTPRSNMSSKHNQEFDKYIQNEDEHKFSDIKKYLQEEEREENILRKVAPIVNTRGVLTVEVDKVLRDLTTYLNSIKSSKVYKAFIGEEAQASLDTQDADPEKSLTLYRQILNEMFRIVVKLNTGVENMGKQSEVMKMKLINSELRQKLQKLEGFSENIKAIQLADDIVQNLSHNTGLSQEISRCVQGIESTSFQINKLQFKLFTLVDLFTDDIDTTQLNMNLNEVNYKCKIYVEQFGHELLNLEGNPLIQSQSSPQKISPEMLSPEETAQLIATVFQKLNNTAYDTGLDANLESNQSFFKTFFSNDEYVKSAENFIRKFKGAQMTHTSTNLPLQMVKNNQIYHRTQGQSVQILNQSKKRSRSQQNNGLQTNGAQSQYTSNVFQQNLLERQNSLYSYQDVLSQGTSKNMAHNQNMSTINTQQNISTFHPLSQAHSQHTLNFHSGPTQPQVYGQQRSHFPPRNTGSFKSVNKSVEMKMGELVSAQNNVNSLFEKLKHNLQSVHASRDNSFQ